MIDQQTFEHLLPLAYEWARKEEEFILTHGSPLSERASADALRAGVRDPSRVRVLVVDRIPLPENPILAEASAQTHVITDASRAVAIGYGIIIRADAWGDRELLVHQLVHVAQRERSGSLEAYVRQYLSDRRECRDFTIGSFEDEARRRAREICAEAAAN
ncbi:MAG TPA: hypothetical protein VG095_09350 [Chthoniobacterales bacterium]|nr:hypothetical protein [Chthoniobacterales bacterium]